MSARNLFGLILISLGVGYIICEVANYPFDTLLAQWWPIFVVLIGLNQLFRFPDHPLLAILITLFGFVLLAGTLNILPVNFWHYVGALILILLGLWILFPRRLHRTTTTRQGGLVVVSAEDQVDETVIFSAMHLRCDSPRFHGGSISATAGSVELDLRGATLAQDGAVLDTCCLRRQYNSLDAGKLAGYPGRRACIRRMP